MRILVIMWNSFALAVQSLTSLPLLASNPTRDDARRAAAWFPLVGGLSGAVLGAIWFVGHRLWVGESLVAAALTLAAGAALTNGMGPGGISRAADGLAAQRGAGDRTQAFAIMRDPRRGTTGLVALGITLTLRLAFLAALPPSLAWPGLILAGAMRGWAMAFAVSAFPAGTDGGAAPAEAGPGEFLAATALAIVCGAGLPTRLFPVLFAVALVVGPLAQSLQRRLGGLNLPLCAALGEVAEIVALACLGVSLQPRF